MRDAGLLWVCPCGHVDPSDYKHVVLDLIFLKYISDAVEEKPNELTWQVQDPQSDLSIAEEAERYQVQIEFNQPTASHT